MGGGEQQLVGDEDGNWCRETLRQRDSSRGRGRTKPEDRHKTRQQTLGPDARKAGDDWGLERVDQICPIGI